MLTVIQQASNGHIALTDAAAVCNSHPQWGLTVVLLNYNSATAQTKDHNSITHCRLQGDSQGDAGTPVQKQQRFCPPGATALLLPLSSVSGGCL